MVLPNVIRTLIPVLVGVLVGWAAKAGFDLDNSAVTAIVTVAVTVAYQALARWLEVNVSPSFGTVLLAFGLTAKKPEYREVPKPVRSVL